jgi:hypothetical protein
VPRADRRARANPTPTPHPPTFGAVRQSPRNALTCTDGRGRTVTDPAGGTCKALYRSSILLAASAAPDLYHRRSGAIFVVSARHSDKPPLTPKTPGSAATRSQGGPDRIHREAQRRLPGPVPGSARPPDVGDIHPRPAREMEVAMEWGDWLDPRCAQVPLAVWADEFLLLAPPAVPVRPADLGRPNDAAGSSGAVPARRSDGRGPTRDRRRAMPVAASVLTSHRGDADDGRGLAWRKCRIPLIPVGVPAVRTDQSPQRSPTSCADGIFGRLCGTASQVVVAPRPRLPCAWCAGGR